MELKFLLESTDKLELDNVFKTIEVEKISAAFDDLLFGARIILNGDRQTMRGRQPILIILFLLKVFRYYENDSTFLYVKDVSDDNNERVSEFEKRAEMLDLIRSDTSIIVEEGVEEIVAQELETTLKKNKPGQLPPIQGDVLPSVQEDETLQQNTTINVAQWPGRSREETPQTNEFPDGSGISLNPTGESEPPVSLETTVASTETVETTAPGKPAEQKQIKEEDVLKKINEINKDLNSDKKSKSGKNASSY